jgi:hypothetical protein
MFDYLQVPECTVKAAAREERHKNRGKVKSKDVLAIKPHAMEVVRGSGGKAPLILGPNRGKITPGLV